jgi:ubiquinone/menaquinone biosynthesis C-methylase UbiE
VGTGKQSAYDKFVVSPMVHRVLATPAVERVRVEVLQQASGRVLEIGFGSGLTLPHYTDAVTELLAVDPDDAGWQRSEPARTTTSDRGFSVERAGRDASDIDLPDGSVDTVVSMWTLCTVPDMRSALSELTRVLRPGGVFVFAEHGPSSRPRRRRLESFIEPVWRPLAGGCHLTREPWKALANLQYAATDVHRPSDSTGLPPGTRIGLATKAE